MAIERLAPLDAPSLAATTAPLSARARIALQQHQRRVAVLFRDLEGTDRVLAGALTACDAASQREMLLAYLETVHELRVGLERLEAFLLLRMTGRGVSGGASVALHAVERGAPPSD
jgi:hypothetical protein